MSSIPMKTYLEPKLAQAITRLAASQRRSESAIIAEAVQAKFSVNSDGVVKIETESRNRALSRIEARLDKLIWEQLQLKHAMLLFVRVWLEHNPPIDEALEESLAASAEARFERFLDLLVQNVTSPEAEIDLIERLGQVDAATLADEGEAHGEGVRS